MATTVFFEEALRGKGRKTTAINLDFGRSSFYHRERLIYIQVGDKTVILDEVTGRRLYEAMRSIGRYLGYDD